MAADQPSDNDTDRSAKPDPFQEAAAQARQSINLDARKSATSIADQFAGIADGQGAAMKAMGFDKSILAPQFASILDNAGVNSALRELMDSPVIAAQVAKVADLGNVLEPLAESRAAMFEQAGFSKVVEDLYSSLPTDISIQILAPYRETFAAQNSKLLDSVRGLAALGNVTAKFSLFPSKTDSVLSESFASMMPPTDFLTQFAEVVDDEDFDHEQLEDFAAAMEASPFWREVVNKLADSAAVRKTLNRKNARLAVMLWLGLTVGAIHILVGAIPYAGGVLGAMGLPGAKDAAEFGGRKFDEKFPPNDEGTDKG